MLFKKKYRVYEMIQSETNCNKLVRNTSFIARVFNNRIRDISVIPRLGQFFSLFSETLI